MKRRDLLRQLANYAADNGLAYSQTEGANHTKVKIGTKQTVIARHNEINEITTKAILKQMGIKS